MERKKTEHHIKKIHRVGGTELIKTDVQLKKSQEHTLKFMKDRIGTETITILLREDSEENINNAIPKNRSKVIVKELGDLLSNNKSGR